MVLTYPLQGNYGIPIGPYESGSIQVQGLIVCHYASTPNHFKKIHTLGEWLIHQEVPALCGIDTRSLTRHLCKFGTISGKLLIDSTSNIEFIDVKHVLDLTTDNSIILYGTSETRVLLIDTGGKENIIRNLMMRGVAVVRVPWNLNWESYIAEVDGIFISNGPGNPSDACTLIDRIRAHLYIDIPIFGICLGNQLLALAVGAKIEKMKYGHRSVNQPVQDLTTGKCYITSQNHGYVINSDTLPDDWKTWFINLNDGTNEGIRHCYKPFRAVQFHPEASPGPNDTNFLFDDFIKTINETKQKKRPNILINKITNKILDLQARS